jgi:hypothetical protein
VATGYSDLRNELASAANGVDYAHRDTGGGGDDAVPLVPLKLCVPKTCANWADALRTPSARSRERCLAGRSWFGLACDDLRLVGLKLIFLVVTRAVSVLGLSRREAWWKDAEILMLHHQLTVALRERPRAHSRLTWPDRAWLALLAGTLPAERLARLRLIVTRPRFCAGTATLSAAGGRGCPAGDVPAGRRCAALCGRWCSAGAGERVMGVPADPR